jgi:hypothetical protein
MRGQVAVESAGSLAGTRTARAHAQAPKRRAKVRAARPGKLTAAASVALSIGTISKPCRPSSPFAIRITPVLL